MGRSEVAEAELETAQELEFGKTSTNPGLHPSCAITTNKYFKLGIGEKFSLHQTKITIKKSTQAPGTQIHNDS